MTIKAVSINQSNTTETNLKDKLSNWIGRSVIIVDRGYQNKQNIEAGVGPEMFRGFGSIAVTLVLLFTAAVASLSVGISTKSLSSALTTGGIISAGAFLAYLCMKAQDPNF